MFGHILSDAVMFYPGLLRHDEIFAPIISLACVVESRLILLRRVLVALFHLRPLHFIDLEATIESIVAWAKKADTDKVPGIF